MGLLFSIVTVIMAELGVEADAAAEAIKFLTFLGWDPAQLQQVEALRSLNAALMSSPDSQGSVTASAPSAASEQSPTTAGEESRAKRKQLDLSQSALLRELFVRHLRLASSSRVLPVSPIFENHRRCAEPKAALAEFSRRETLRYLRFRRESRFDLVCLDWPSPLGWGWAFQKSGLGRCADTWNFVHAEPYEVGSQWGVENERREIHGDLRILRHEFPQLEGQFDLIFCSMVLEHAADPFEAMNSLAFMLAPRGQLVVEAPFMQAFHGGGFFRYPDFWRFTTQGLGMLADRAGLTRIALNVTEHGAAHVAGSLLGLGVCDFDPSDERDHRIGCEGQYYVTARLLARRSKDFRAAQDAFAVEHGAQRQWT